MSIALHKSQRFAVFVLILLTILILGFVLLIAVTHVNGWHAILSSRPDILHWSE